jgi:hypothetical protein
MAEKYLTGALALIALYLVAGNWAAFNGLLATSGSVINSNITVLQGR